MSTSLGSLFVQDTAAERARLALEAALAVLDEAVLRLLLKLGEAVLDRLEPTNVRIHLQL